MAEPTMMPATIQPRLWLPESTSVTPIASAMPAAAMRIPSGAVAGEERRFRPQMKSTAQSRYARSYAWRSSIATLPGPALEHVQHPVGDQETADHVDGAEDDGDRAQHLDQVRVGGPDDHDRAHDDDPVDGVRPRHQRRVQRGRHLGDDFEADERRQ